MRVFQFGKELPTHFILWLLALCLLNQNTKVEFSDLSSVLWEYSKCSFKNTVSEKKLAEVRVSSYITTIYIYSLRLNITWLRYTGFWMQLWWSTKGRICLCVLGLNPLSSHSCRFRASGKQDERKTDRNKQIQHKRFQVTDWRHSGTETQTKAENQTKKKAGGLIHTV